MALVFDYDFGGENFLGKIYRPVAKVTFKSKVGDKKASTWMVVDTGADHSILPRYMVEKLGVSLEDDCVKDVTFGVGGGKTIYFLREKIEASLDGVRRMVPISFIDSDEVPALLGRLGFLELFDVEFLKKKKVIFRE